MTKKPALKMHDNGEGLDWMHRELFQQIPFNAAIIDREFNIIEANKSFKQYFGLWKNKKCYEAYKKANRPCPHCGAALVFKDGRARVSDEIGVDLYGRAAHYVVHSAPLRQRSNKKIDFVLEMSTDVTETKHWQQEYHILFDRVPCYITVINRDYKITRANESFRENFGDVAQGYCYEVYKKRDKKCARCPAARTFRDGKIHKSEQTGINKAGEKTHYIVMTAPLGKGVGRVEHVIEISTDITDLKHLEADMLEAERLAAVGQTVAGLAHSIKNILMGLEGGMYIVSLGLAKDDKTKISEGWEILERNFKKTTTLVKDFLNFARGQTPNLELADPNEVVQEVVELFGESVNAKGIKLIFETKPQVKPAPLDRKGIHTCLTNLISNAIDACMLSEAARKFVEIRVFDERDALIFEVTDNGCGLDYEIKKKIFTTFFTTKGGQGTGLGLLTTRKIINEHGGKILVRSQKGQGARFRIELPRKRLDAFFKKSREETES